MLDQSVDDGPKAVVDRLVRGVRATASLPSFSGDVVCDSYVAAPGPATLSAAGVVAAAPGAAPPPLWTARASVQVASRCDLFWIWMREKVRRDLLNCPVELTIPSDA